MNKTSELSDEQVVSCVINGEKPLYEIIVRRYNPYLYKVGRSYNFNHEDTQDLMQDSFVDAYRSLEQFKGNASLKTWLIRIMMNKCFHKKQKSSFKNEIAKEIHEYSTPIFSDMSKETEKITHSRELRHILESAIAQIPDDYRMVFSLREINGLNTVETADLLGITESNVKVRLNRSKTMLRSIIEQSYSGAELFEFNLVYCDAIVENVMKRI